MTNGRGGDISVAHTRRTSRRLSSRHPWGAGLSYTYFKLSTAVLLLLVIATPLRAAEPRIGFVDAERINRESIAAETTSKRLENEFAPRVEELRSREVTIKNLQHQVEEIGSASASDRRGKERELSRLTLEFQRLQRLYREDLDLRRNQEMQTLVERANRVIEQIAKRERYDLIVQDAVYHGPRVDITEQVLKALAAQR